MFLSAYINLFLFIIFVLLFVVFVALLAPQQKNKTCKDIRQTWQTAVSGRSVSPAPKVSFFSCYFLQPIYTLHGIHLLTRTIKHQKTQKPFLFKLSFKNILHLISTTLEWRSVNDWITQLCNNPFLFSFIKAIKFSNSDFF